MSFCRFHLSFASIGNRLELFISSCLVPSHCRSPPPLGSAPASKTELKPTCRSNPLPDPSPLHRSAPIILHAMQSRREQMKSRTRCRDKLRLGLRQEDEASEDNGRCLRSVPPMTSEASKHGKDLACLELHELGEAPPSLSCSRARTAPASEPCRPPLLPTTPSFPLWVRRQLGSIQCNCSPSESERRCCPNWCKK
jgi:hypothetical protein